MLRASREWDVRCPKALARMFPVRKGYYYKVDRQQAQRICRLLSKAYGITTPTIGVEGPERGNNGECWYLPNSRQSLIKVHARAHIKSVFHEWYHSLDYATKGKYRSDDRRGGPSSLAWQFADRLFEVFRVMK